MTHKMSLSTTLLISTLLIGSSTFAAENAEDIPNVSAYPDSQTAQTNAPVPASNIQAQLYHKQSGMEKNIAKNDDADETEDEPSTVKDLRIEPSTVKSSRTEPTEEEADENMQDDAKQSGMEKNEGRSDDAEDESFAPTRPASIVNLPEKAPISYISGGIGDEDLNRMKSLQHNYDCKLLITEANGTFLSDVNVQIADMKGNTLVDTTTDGPIFLAKLPAGRYKVTALRHTETKERTISIKSGRLSAYQIAFRSTDPKTSGDPKTTSLE